MGIIETLKLQERRQGVLEGERKGRLEGKQEANCEFVSNLISATKFDDNRIAALAAVPVDFVRKVRSEQANKK